MKSYLAIQEDELKEFDYFEAVFLWYKGREYYVENNGVDYDNGEKMKYDKWIKSFPVGTWEIIEIDLKSLDDINLGNLQDYIPVEYFL